MRNRKLVLWLLVLLLCYLLGQTVLYVLSQRNRSISAKQPTLHQDEKIKETQNITTADPLWNLKIYLELAHNAGIPVILLDPDVLQNVITPPQTRNLRCTFFCDSRQVTSLGVSSKMWTHDRLFIQVLKDRGFSIVYFTETGKEALHYLSIKDASSVYTHYLFHRGAHTIHLIVLFSVRDGYLWTAGLSISNGHGDMGDSVRWWREVQHNMLLWKHARIFTSMQFIKVTMDGLKLRAPKYPNTFLQEIPQSTFFPCNQSRADLFHTLYGNDTADDDEFVKSFRDANHQILAQAKKTLDSLSIRFWLSSGTCLGWYRQCDSIHYSGDVDIGIWIKDYDRRLIPTMAQNGLQLRHIFGKESDSYELSFVNEEIKLDIFFFYEDADSMWNGGTRASTGQKYKYIFPKFTLCWTEFLELIVRIPCETEQYLEANYGTNWFKPVKHWDWKTSPSNVVENGLWVESEWNEVIQIFE